MKKLCNIITYLAAFVCMLGVCTLDANPVLGFGMMFVSGIWIAARTYVYEEKRRLREGR